MWTGGIQILRWYDDYRTLDLILHVYAFFAKGVTMLRYGVLKWFDSKKGYGFITSEETGQDVFVHITQMQKAGIVSYTEGQRMSYDLYDDKGRTAAGNLQLVENVLK